MSKVNEFLKRLWNDEDGLGTLEILLIVAVLVAIAIIFRKWIVSWFQKLIGESNSSLKDNGGLPSCVPSADASC